MEQEGGTVPRSSVEGMLLVSHPYSLSIYHFQAHNLASECLHCGYLLEGSFWLLQPTPPKLERARELTLLGAALYQ